MSERVAGKVALVTGAARGQGRAHAIRLAEEGADIIALDVARDVDHVAYPMGTAVELKETAAAVEALGRRVYPHEVDIRDFAALSTAISSSLEHTGGRLDIVVANAGVSIYGSAVDQTEAQWDTVLDTNLKAQWLTAKAAAPAMIAAGHGGSVIFTSSLGGIKGFPNAIGYIASKFGVIGVARALAHELAPHRIRSNVVNPTNVNTPMIDNDDLLRRFRPDLESPRLEDTSQLFTTMNLWPQPWVEPVDIANAVLWLASDESRYVTGINLPVDLGASAR